MAESKTDLPGWIIAEELPVSDVSPNHRGTLVPRLGHDRELAGTIDRCLCCQTSPEAVTRELRWANPYGFSSPFDDQRDGLTGKPLAGHCSVPVDAPKNCAIRDTGHSEPFFEYKHRTGGTVYSERDGFLHALRLLIRLAPPEVDDHAFFLDDDIFDVEAHQFGSPERTSETYQQDCPVLDSRY